MPEWRKDIERRLGGVRLDAAQEAAIVDEWANHLEDRYEELLAGGTSENEARRAVLQELDNSDLLPVTLGRPSHSDPVPAGAAASGNIFTGLWHDLRYAARMLRKSPGFTAVVVLTLALGIGANTTVFTVINTLLLNPLSVDNPSGLRAIYTIDGRSGSNAGKFLLTSYLNLKDYEEKNQCFSSVAGYTPAIILTMDRGAGSEHPFAELVTRNYFETLGLHPFRGRFFLPEEESTPGTHAVAVISYGSWQQRFGGTTDIAGRTIKLNNIVFTIVGVAPQGFKGVNAIFGPDFWIPAMMARQIEPAQHRDALTNRGELAFRAFGRLKAGITAARAEANMKTLASSLEKEYPEPNQGHSVTLRPFSEAALGDINRQQIVFGSAVLLAVVGLVLLIACSNVANLLLARAAGRRHEIAARLALGASRSRLVRQLLTESSLLGLLSGALGLLLADEGCLLLWRSFRPAGSANFIDPKFDAGVFVFALVLSLITGVLFGIAPAVQASRTSIVEALKDETRTAGRSRRAISFGNALLVGQVALSLVSLIIAGLFLRSMQRAYTIDPGFETKRLGVALIGVGQAGYDRAQSEQFFRDVRARVSAIPGVASLSWASNMPFWNRASRGITMEGQALQKKSEVVMSIVNTVDLDYFDTMRIAVRRGRDFTAADRDGAIPVAIINETLAARYWPNQDPIGKRFKFSGESFFRQIVGVAKTINYSALGEEPQSCIYLPFKQNFSDSMVLYVRTEHDPQTVLPAIQGVIRTVAPQISVGRIDTGSQMIGYALFSAVMGVGLLGVFGLLALGLASIGLYGIMAYSVARRRREIGVRMALGAAQSSVLGLVLRQGMTLVAVGIVVGLAASFLIAQALSKVLYGVSAADPISFAAASLILATVALLACYLPARRASRVDPLDALREA